MFWDSHAHQIAYQTGGFLIALENGDKNVVSNQELRNMNLNSNFLPVEYVTNSFQDTVTKIVKYHPRNEKYTPIEIMNDIKERSPKGVIFDTLNEPDWCPYDYWKIARAFPKIQFLFSHSGGYKVMDFIEICEFNNNVWLDFSFTQNYFGLIGEKAELRAVTDNIRYAFNSAIKSKILFGSDYPYEDQEECISFYERNMEEEIYTLNFESLLQRLYCL